MGNRARLFAAALSIALLGACATDVEYREERASTAVSPPAPIQIIAGAEGADPREMNMARESAPAKAAPLKKKARRTAAAKPAQPPAMPNGAGMAKHAAAPASADFDAEARLLERRDAYLKQMKQAAYAFNPPTPIKVATPVTIHFWLDPVTEAAQLARELEAKLLAMQPDGKPVTESGRMEWSPRMRATLTGDDFDITPTEEKGIDGIKSPSASRRTEWSWDIKARRIGERLPLHLRVWSILPRELGEAEEVLKLDKHIQVEVTLWWLLDEFWEKYWKWLLGGIGTAIAGALAAWWKSRQQTMNGKGEGNG